MKQHNYFIYIVTNTSKTVFYTGVTNNLEARLYEHYLNRGNDKSFAGKYYGYNLIHYERFQYIQHAIDREKEIKGWQRSKKLDLINAENPQLRFYNEEVCTKWPPPEGVDLRQSYN